MRHCPRCGSNEVSGHPTPATPYNEEELGFRCDQCTFQETRALSEPDYDGWRARWETVKPMSYEELAAGVARRAAIDDQREREWNWPVEHDPPSWDAVSDRKTRAAKLEEHLAEKEYAYEIIEGSGSHYSYVKRLPQNTELFARILDDIESDEPRQAYADWIRTTADPRATDVADFVDCQLRVARALRDDPRSSIMLQHPDGLFENRDAVADWWHIPLQLEDVLRDTLTALLDEGLIADLRWHRGFVEHVTIKAQRFLEVADELFSLAPIRHLTITCARGLDHQDTGVWKALLASPHLSRIRSLRFPARNVDHPLAELNRLTDDDIELLAASTQVRGLRYLEFTDARALTIRAFAALARSENLPELSAVRHDLYRYEQLGNFGFASVGPHTQTLAPRPLEAYREALEKEHGRLPWLHVSEHYGSDTPDVEAVVEHPVRRARR